jgi:hypothetical protein
VVARAWLAAVFMLGFALYAAAVAVVMAPVAVVGVLFVLPYRMVCGMFRRPAALARDESLASQASAG